MFRPLESHHTKAEAVIWKVLKPIGNMNMISRDFQVFWQFLSFGPILVIFVLGLNCAIYLQLGIGWPPQLRLFSVKQCKLGNMNLIFQDISNILAMFAFWPRLSNVSAIGPPPHSTEAVCWKAMCLACAVEAPTLVRRLAARGR